MTDQEPDREPNNFEARRRNALKRLATYGAYTAPLKLGMLTASKAVADSYTPPKGCCWVDSHPASGQKVGDAGLDAPLRMMRPDGTGTLDGSVERMRSPKDQPCRTFSTCSGIALTLSHSTPVPVRQGKAVRFLSAADVIEGDVLAVEDDAGFRWEPLVAI